MQSFWIILVGPETSYLDMWQIYANLAKQHIPNFKTWGSTNNEYPQAKHARHHHPNISWQPDNLYSCQSLWGGAYRYYM